MSACDWISARRVLLDAATEGPWSAADEHGDVPGATPAWCVSQMRPGFEAMPPEDGYLGDVVDVPTGSADAALIADSRTSLPKALDALEAVLEQVSAMEALVTEGLLVSDVADSALSMSARGIRGAITVALGIEAAS